MPHNRAIHAQEIPQCKQQRQHAHPGDGIIKRGNGGIVAERSGTGQANRQDSAYVPCPRFVPTKRDCEHQQSVRTEGRITCEQHWFIKYEEQDSVVENHQRCCNDERDPAHAKAPVVPDFY
jgi:hypothetical protein